VWSVALEHIVLRLNDVDALALIESMPAVVRVLFGRRLRTRSAMVRANPHFFARYAVNLVRSGDRDINPVTLVFAHAGQCIDAVAVIRASRVGQSFVAHRCALQCSTQIVVQCSQIDDDERDAIASIRNAFSLRLYSTDVVRLRWNDAWNLKKFTATRCQLRALPTQLRHMRALWMLDVSSNCLTELPEDAAYYDSLVSLNVSSNQLERLPDALHDAHNLMRLAASRNRLRPTTLPRMPSSLRELDVTGNADITRLEHVLEAVWECSERMLIAVQPDHARCLCCDEMTPEEQETCPAAAVE